MTSYRTSGMKHSLCNDIGGVGLFCCAEVPKIVYDAVHLNDGSPFTMVPISTKKSGTGSFLRFALILNVFCLRNIPKVANPIVCFPSVDVVNMVGWEGPVNIEPSKAMQRVGFIFNLRSVIPVTVNASNRMIDWKAIAGFYKPCKHASILVVVKKFAQACCGKIGLSHDAVLSLIGQRPGSVSALSGLRYFSTGVM